MIEKRYKKGDRLHAEDFNALLESIKSVHEKQINTLVIDIPISDVARIIFSGKSNGVIPDEYLVNEQLGFGLKEIGDFIDGKLNVKLTATIQDEENDIDATYSMSLDNSAIDRMVGQTDYTLNGEKFIIEITIFYALLNWNIHFGITEHYCTAYAEPVENNDLEISDKAQTALDTAKEAFKRVEEISGNTYQALDNAQAAVNTANNAQTEVTGISERIQELTDAGDEIISFTSLHDMVSELTLIGDSKCISLQNGCDEVLNSLYLQHKSTASNVGGDIMADYFRNANIYRTLTPIYNGMTLPTMTITNVAYPDYNMDIIIGNEDVQKLIEEALGVSDVARLRMLEAPITVGTDKCYWALVQKDGTVLNPGTY